jgi:hypothetical protein
MYIPLTLLLQAVLARCMMEECDAISVAAEFMVIGSMYDGGACVLRITAQHASSSTAYLWISNLRTA